MIKSSSSDSELGESFKNVSKLLTKSRSNQQEELENYAYKRRLGDLIFDANFESGNLGFIEQVDRYEYDLMVRPDVANARHRLWFNFIVSNQRPNQCVIFTFVNLSKNIRLFQEGFTPVVRSKSKPNWIRLHKDQVFYYRSQNHSNRFVLSIAFRFSSYDDDHQFALTYPYTHTNLNNFINRWVVELKRNNKKNYTTTTTLAITRESLKSHTMTTKYKKAHRGESPELYITNYNKALRISKDEQLRTRSSLETRSSDFIIDSSSSSSFASSDITKLSIEKLHANKVINHDLDNNKFNFDPRLLCTSLLSKSIYHLSIKGFSLFDNKPKVVILCRSCGNIDASAFLVCQGILDFMLSDHKIAKASRRCLDLDIYPMLNPDSVYVGNSHSDLMGQVKVPIREIINNEKNQLLYENFYSFYKNLSSNNNRLVIIELSVNFNIIGSRMLGSYYENSLHMERHLSFPRLLSRFASDFYLEYCEFSKKKSTCWPTYLEYNIERASGTDDVDHYFLEISPYGYYKRTLLERSYEEYNQEKYFRLGKAVVYSLLEFLRPKNETLPTEVSNILESFQQTAHDIDDLIISIQSWPQLD